MWAPRRTHARPLPTAPPDTLLTHSSILENTGALEQRHVDATERVGGRWVGGVAGGRRAGRAREDGAVEAAASELDGSGEVEGGAAEGAETLPYFTVNSTAVPVYDAFCAAPGFQCGFCTPGMVMTSLACLEKRGAPSPDQMRQDLSGNLCRCGTYGRVMEAISRTANGGK